MTMRYAHHFMLASGLLAVIGLATTVGAEIKLGNDFEADELVQKISVMIKVGADGEPLDEPVALDLGLGFKLWLMPPKGQNVDASAIFGAVAQDSALSQKIDSGESGTFTFDVDADNGSDRLGTTPQLLAGVRISDISRVGIVSAGQTDWMLSSYEIHINGRLFIANNSVHATATQARNDAKTELKELRPAMKPLLDEANSLRALQEASLATDEDMTRLAEVDSAIAPLQRQIHQLEALLQGEFPWFVEDDFRSPHRGEAHVRSAKVTLLTASHVNADTQNFIYFSTGGHKYLMSSPDNPLSSEIGPREFEIDLTDGPLTAADVRGTAVGMLAHSGNYAKAPDRWHPQRVIVELDGRIVYDSDTNSLDKASLEAIRLIPPAHFDAEGQLVENNPISRETYLWVAGTGMGLNPADGGSLELPDEDDPKFPEAEPGVDPEIIDLPDDDAFPGEPPFPPDAPWWPPSPGGFEPLPWPYPPGPVFPPPVPPAFGDTFMVEDVTIAEGSKIGDAFKVTWTVTGDDSPVDFYLVELLHYDPEQLMPGAASVTLADGIVLPGQVYEFSAVIGATPVEGKFVLPKVTAVALDPLSTPHNYLGPAKPLFRDDPETIVMDANFQSVPGGPGVISVGGEPPGADRAVFVFGQGESTDQILFDSAAPGVHLGIRPEAGDQVFAVSAIVPTLLGKFRVNTHVGFLHETEGAETFGAMMRYWLEPVGGGAPLFISPAQPIENGISPDGPMKELAVDVDTAAAGAGPKRLVIAVYVAEAIPAPGTLNPTQRPACFGLRVVPFGP